ncbi:MAG: AAA family ATPase [Betaproteobacteria bacterium]|nr:AAA family ATPase [Betaproteobacteria bacterium]
MTTPEKATPGGSGQADAEPQQKKAAATLPSEQALVEIEHAVVGVLLCGAAQAVQSLDLTGGQFLDPGMGAAFDAVRALVAAGKNADVVAVHLELMQRGQQAACPLSSLNEAAMNWSSRPDMLAQHVERIKEGHRHRRLRAIGIALAANPASAEQHLRDAERLLGEVEAPPLFREVALNLDDDSEDDQRWYWQGYMPAGHVTLLTGHGGSGKSLSGLQLAACMAVGEPCLGRDTVPARVLYFSAEDPASLVRVRLRRICRRLCLDHAVVMERLKVLDASDLEPVLFTERRIEGVTHGVTTATFTELQRYIDKHGSEVVIVDNASDAFDSDEIKRALVRQFVRSLATLVRKRDGAVLLLAHVDKSTARAGKSTGTDSYSGSTAWNNSVRSRLFLVEHSAGELELRHEKCNVGPKQPPLLLRWDTNDVMCVRAVGGMVALIQERNDLKTILRLAHEFYSRGVFVATDTRSRYHAAKVLGDDPAYPKSAKPNDVFRLLTDAEARGLIKKEAYRDHNRKPHERWALTTDGLESIGAAPSAPCAPSTEDGAPSHMAQQGAPSAPCSAGGYGGIERAQNTAQEGKS